MSNGLFNDRKEDHQATIICAFLSAKFCPVKIFLMGKNEACKKVMSCPP